MRARPLPKLRTRSAPLFVLAMGGSATSRHCPVLLALRARGSFSSSLQRGQLAGKALHGQTLQIADQNHAVCIFLLQSHLFPAGTIYAHTLAAFSFTFPWLSQCILLISYQVLTTAHCCMSFQWAQAHIHKPQLHRNPLSCQQHRKSPSPKIKIPMIRGKIMLLSHISSIWC